MILRFGIAARKCAMHGLPAGSGPILRVSDGEIDGEASLNVDKCLRRIASLPSHLASSHQGLSLAAPIADAPIEHERLLVARTRALVIGAHTRKLPKTLDAVCLAY